MSRVDPIVICEHDPRWKTEFAEIAARLRDGLGDAARRIDHIGSTSIPGLAAKPVIDVQVSVVSLEPMDTYLPSMESLGYRWRKDNPETTKRYFRESPGGRRTHIHVRKAGSWHEQGALLFRDYLRLHPTDRDLYESTKRSLAVTFREDREAYTEAKATVVWEILRRADRWAGTIGWEPGPTDA